MSEFEILYPWLIKHEGGKGCDPDDVGGFTSFGMTQKDVDECDLDCVPEGTRVEDLTQEQAKAMTKAIYWDRPGVGRLPQLVATKLGDCGVLWGTVRTIKWLQDALRLEGEWIRSDGKIGPLTLEAVLRQDPVRLVARLCAFAGARSMEIVKDNHTQQKFLEDWLDRAGDWPPT